MDKSCGCKSPNAKKGVAAIMFGSFILMFITTTGSAILQKALGVTTASTAIELSLIVSICFAVSTMSISYIYAKKSLILYFIDGGYHILGITLANIVLACWP